VDCKIHNALQRRCEPLQEQKIQAYEIWNEPDLAHVGNLRPETFGVLLQSAFNAIKAIDSHAAVVSAGMASGDPNYIANARRATGGKFYADGIGVHPYGQRPTPDWPTPDWGFGVITDLMRNYFNVEKLPLWVTEVGTDDTYRQAEFPFRTFAALDESHSHPFTMGPVFWFCWSAGMVPPYGLLDGNGNRKPSYASFDQYAHSQSRGVNATE